MDEDEDFERKRAARIARNRSVLEQLKVPQLAAALASQTVGPTVNPRLHTPAPPKPTAPQRSASARQAAKAAQSRLRDQAGDHSESGSDGEPSPCTRSSKQQAIGQRGKGPRRGGTSAPPGDDDEYDPSIESDGAEEEEEQEEAADKAVEDLSGSNASGDAQGTVQQLAVHPPQKRRRSAHKAQAQVEAAAESPSSPWRAGDKPPASASMTTAAASAQQVTRGKAAEAGWLGGDSEEDDVQLQLALALSLQQPDNAPCSAPCQASQQEAGTAAAAAAVAPAGAAAVPANGSAQDDAQGACTAGQAGSQAHVKAAETRRGSGSAVTGKAGEKRRKGSAGVQTSRTGWDDRFTEGEVLQVFQALQPNKQGLLTRSALATAMDKLGLDSNDMRLQSMLEYAAEVVGSGGKVETLAGDKPCIDRLSFDQFQRLVADLV